MKARLIRFQGELQLLLCTGKIKTVSNVDAREFLLRYDDSQYYSGRGVWEYEGMSMEEYRGDTIAIVDDAGDLCIRDAAQFRNLIEQSTAEFLTVSEYAEIHGKQTAIVRRMCQNGRIEGVVQKGKTWLIPKDSPYPSDARVRR